MTLFKPRRKGNIKPPRVGEFLDCGLSKHAKKSVREIGRELGVPKSTVGRIVKRSNDVTIKRRGRCGRKRKTTARDDQMIIKESIKDSRKTSVDLKKDLFAAGVNIDSSTIRSRRLKNLCSKLLHAQACC